MKEYEDKYFRRAKEILIKEDLNPIIQAQVFIRKGPGIVGGIEESLQLLKEHSNFFQNGGKAYALNDGDKYEGKETLLQLIGYAQDFITFETQYLGIISKATTLASGDPNINLNKIESNMRKIVSLSGGRPVSYFGARHWDYRDDAAISDAAFKGGATSCSTDAGARTRGQEGIGTIPHVLENIYAWKYGMNKGVEESTKAFDKYIDKTIPRIALIDYNNKEITDSINTALALQGNLYGVRVDTCGENLAEGAVNGDKLKGLKKMFGYVPKYNKYWTGNGVTVTGVYALRKALDQSGMNDVKIFLTSGFGDSNKIKAFNEAEKELGIQLYDSLGVGGIYESRAATMDVVGIGNTFDDIQPISKVGREYQPNERLEQKIDYLV